ncbi:hypothetical protein CPB83DRAFT_861674 [Crepidotus variabilis]|uniref:ER-bound oxygenase mpaB/mpaB'/Rubber oxygenase catalytic domain-containing protein n=1 Tax=Crepidotus variabilis TaxID=179855 RepID=A0A9P6JKW9_9AGAR|nr:hypothetical protein CPB83DRAFT_861674 [Crepidotus variabilis]
MSGFFEHLWTTLNNSFSKITSLQATVIGVSCWLLLVKSQRWKKYDAIHKKYGPKWNNGQGKITAAEAQVIIRMSLHNDMAFLMNYALSFALFKTYAIPSISKLLLGTKQLGSKEMVSRRYADTAILISTFFTCPYSGFWDPDVGRENQELGDKSQPAEDPRAMIAVARMNWIHSHYTIPNRDYVYTLSLFILEPARWAERYGWRPLSPLEKHAYFVFWVDLANKMGMQDVPESIGALEDLVEQFESKYMVPAKSNHETAIHTFNELLGAIPKAFGLRKHADSIAICLLEDNVREAMMFPKQSAGHHSFTQNLLKFVSFVQCHLLLPRASTNPRLTVDNRRVPDTDPCPRLHMKKWPMKPWYKPESIGLGYYAMKLQVALGIFSDMPGPHLKSNGYRLEEIGPVELESSGYEEVFNQAAKMQGCPISGPWSLEARRKEQA